MGRSEGDKSNIQLVGLILRSVKLSLIQPLDVRSYPLRRQTCSCPPTSLSRWDIRLDKLDSQREEFETPTGLSRLVNEIRR